MLWRLPPVVSDAVVALVVGVFSVGNAFHDGHRLWLNVPLAVLGAASLLVRRRHPLAVLGVLTVLCLPLAAQGQYWLYPAVLFALFTAAQRGPRPWAARMSAAAVGVIGLTVLVKQGFNIGPVIAPAAFTAAAWVWGVNVRTRDLEREEQARAAVGAERARIAGELHDVITHNVSVMVVQAAAGNDVFDARPDQAREALQAVEATGRSTLAELRLLLGVASDDEEAANAPQPGLAQLDALVARVRAAGLPAELTLEGKPGELPTGVDLSAFRIVQESLTNTLRHARASRACVRVRYEPDALELAVTDDGVGAASTDGGRGLVGMRERVALFGGEFTAGSPPGGGFAIRARMPLGAS